MSTGHLSPGAPLWHLALPPSTLLTRPQAMGRETALPLKILKAVARRVVPYEASTSIISNILKVSGCLTVLRFGTGFLMDLLGLGLVWGWFGLVWP